MKNSPPDAQNSQINLEMNTVNADSTASAPPSYEEATNFINVLPPTSSTSHPIGTTTPHLSPQHIGFNVNAGASQPNAQQPVIIIQQQLVLGPEPALVLCPACHVHKVTRIERVPSSGTHLVAVLLCLFGFWFCVCLPYCFEIGMNSKHYCGNCNQYLGTYNVLHRQA